LLFLFIATAALFAPVLLRSAPAPNAGARTDEFGDPLPRHVLRRFGTVRLRRGGPIQGMAISADGKIIVSHGLWDISVWDSSTGRELRHLAEIEGGVGAITLSRDGKQLAWGAVKGQTIRILDVASGRHTFTLNEPEYHGDQLAWLADGKALAIQCTNDVRLLDVAKQTVRSTFGPPWNTEAEKRNPAKPHRIRCFALSADDKRLLTGHEDGTAHLWDIDQGCELHHWRHENKHIVEAVAFSADGRLFAVRWYNSTLRVGSVATGKELDPQPKFQENLGHRVALSPDGKRLAYDGQMGQVELIATDTGKATRTLDAHAGPIFALAFTPNGETLVTAGHDGCIRRWDPDTGRERPPTHPHRGAVTVLLSPDGSHLVTLSWEYTLHCWDTAAGKLLYERETAGEGQDYLAISPDGKRLTDLNRNHSLTWDLLTGRELSRTAFDPVAVGRALSPDGTKVVQHGDKYLKVWQVSPRRELFQVKQDAIDFAFSPDGRWLAASFDKGRVRIWEAADGKHVRDFAETPGLGVLDLALTPDRRLLITLGDPHAGHPIYLWDTETGAALRTPAGEQGAAHCLAVSPDGKTLAVGEDGGLIRLWELATGRQRGNLKGHQGAIASLSFSADGKRLASGSGDTTALLWDLTSAATGGQRPTPDLDRLWADLLGDDAATAYHAVALLGECPERSVPYLRSHLSAPNGNAKRLAGLVAHLDSADFDQRQRAHAELLKYGGDAWPVLRDAAKDSPSAEVRRRAGALLEALQPERYLLRGERLRTWRALEALEKCATPEACEMLADIAKGDANTALTGEARLALERLRERGVTVP
jgi:WD40 repeat protein